MRLDRLVLCVTVLLIVTCSKPALSQMPPAARAAPVVVQPVRLEKVSRHITVVGTVEPYRRTTVASEVAGIVLKMPVWQGDLVRAGQILCVLKTDTEEIQKRQALAELKRLQQRLAELESGTRKEEIARAKAALEEARALLEKWETEKQHVQKTYEAGAASEKEYRDTMAAYRAAAMRLAQAAATYELAVNGPRPEEIAQARYAVEAQRASVDLIADRIAKATIKSPFEGFVTKRFAEVGQWINIGGPVAEVIELDRVLVRVDVPEEYIALIRLGTQATVKIDALKRHFTGTVRHIIPQASAASRTFPVEVEVTNPNYVIKAGMFARAMLPIDRQAPQVLVPKDAVRSTPQGTIVFTVANGRAVPVPVMVTGGWKEYFTVQAALKPGMPVIVRGNERLIPGQPVRVTNASAMQPAGQPVGNGQESAPGAAQNAQRVRHPDSGQ